MADEVLGCYSVAGGDCGGDGLVFQTHPFQLIGIAVVVALAQFSGEVDLLANHAFQHEVVRTGRDGAVECNVVFPGGQAAAQHAEILGFLVGAALAGELGDLYLEQCSRFENVGDGGDLQLRTSKVVWVLLGLSKVATGALECAEQATLFEDAESLPQDVAADPEEIGELAFCWHRVPRAESAGFDQLEEAVNNALVAPPFRRHSECVYRVGGYG